MQYDVAAKPQNYAYRGSPKLRSRYKGKMVEIASKLVNDMDQKMPPERD